MQTANAAAIVKIKRNGRHLALCLYSNPGPFPFGPPGTMGKAQYIGISKHLVLTLMEDRYLSGLLAFQADCPMTPSGQPIHWVGGVSCNPWKGDLWYNIHTLFLRDAAQLLGKTEKIQLAAQVTGVNGRLSNRQYWLVEIPSITREVLLNIDEIVIVRRRAKWRPAHSISARVARGEFWQMAGFQEHPIYETRRDEKT